MDAFKSFLPGHSSHPQQPAGQPGQPGQPPIGGGGGPASEAQEDMLDKAVDFVQEKFLKQGPQNNESPQEQAKDEAISDAIRAQYKKMTGKDFPVPDKNP
ncbi:hypothetical protein HK104_000522 [Borealophlyctis nickersoniae]|nr:hypothetical protein HK104_000522 [Borealophlyctis nickersoniae]